nr:MAG TPA: hypothetical protein [Caudoviricetes sp.]
MGRSFILHLKNENKLITEADAFHEANKQYKDIIASLDALKRGEISGSKANADIMRAFDRVDESIQEYKKQ